VTLRARLALLSTALLAAVLGIATAVLVRLDAADGDRRLAQRARDLARPRPLPPQDASIDALRLAAEPDGVRVVLFVYETQPNTWRLRARGGTGTASASGLMPAGVGGLVSRVEAARWTPSAPPETAEIEYAGARWTAAVGAWPPPPEGRPPPPDREGERPPRFVAVALVDRAPEAARRATYLLRVLLVDAGALLLGAGLSYLLARRMLRPLAVAAAAAERVSSPKERLPTGSASDELGRLVGVLNAMLARLEDASERERRFLASASHELRRPLAALLGELELGAAPGRDAQGLRAAIGVALEDARTMNRLLDDLVDHARAQAGRLALEVQDTDLVEVVAGAVERSRRALSGALAIDVREIPPRVLRMDPDAMRRVLENLIVNAATHGGEDVRVCVSVESDAAGVRLHVDDDGPGVPPEEAARLFEPFGRGDRARSVRGMGLGLAIARAVVEAHGGRLTLVSPLVPGDARPGTRFTVALPAALEASE
jgi:signal transduction histidine kinase